MLKKIILDFCKNSKLLLSITPTEYDIHIFISLHLDFLRLISFSDIIHPNNLKLMFILVKFITFALTRPLFRLVCLMVQRNIL